MNKIIFGTIASYIGLRHVIPKEEIILLYKKDGSGDRLLSHSHVNCILFDSLETWYDSDLCYSINKYYWKRIKLEIK